MMPLKIVALAAGMVFPVTLLSGACFPFMARIVLRRAGHEGRELGALYSVNTVGGILGALLAGFVLLPLVGDRHSFLSIAFLYLASGTLCWLAAGRRGPALATALAGGVVGVVCMPPESSLSRALIDRLGGQIHSHVETPEATVTAFQGRKGRKHLYVNGHGMTALCTDTKYMAHLPLLLHPDPKDVLVVCFGMGTTFRSASLHPHPVTAVELQPSVPGMFEFFHPDAPRVLADPKNQIRVGDGRTFLLLAEEEFSVITVDPAPPMHSAGTVNLYTREFLELCAQHLDPPGILCLWIPNHDCTEDDFRLLLRTFHDVFAHAQLWIGGEELGYYLIGSRQPLVLRPARLAALQGNAAVVSDLAEYRADLGLSAERLARTFLLGTRGIERYTADERRLLTDDRPYTEFPWLQWIRAGRGVWQTFMSQEKLAAFREPPGPGVMPGG
jgi:spermidine synthase